MIRSIVYCPAARSFATAFSLALVQTSFQVPTLLDGVSESVAPRKSYHCALKYKRLRFRIE